MAFQGQDWAPLMSLHIPYSCQSISDYPLCLKTSLSSHAGLANVCSAADRFVQVSCTLPKECWTQQTYANSLQGINIVFPPKACLVVHWVSLWPCIVFPLYSLKGTLRVLLVLLHDFPEFLCDYHYGFCDVIPPNCIQLRNLILSAFPRNMRLPDPFTPNLKVESCTSHLTSYVMLCGFNLKYTCGYIVACVIIGVSPPGGYAEWNQYRSPHPH